MGTDFERDDKMMKNDDENVDYYMRWRLKLEGETENMGVCTKERKGVTAPVLMATPCTNSLGGESGGQKHESRPSASVWREQLNLREPGGRWTVGDGRRMRRPDNC